MRHPTYRQLPIEPLEPTFTPEGIDVDAQGAHLVALRELQNAIPMAQFARDNLLVALSLSGALSRRDMALACGLNKSRVDQIIAAHSEHLQVVRNEAARELNRRRQP